MSSGRRVHERHALELEVTVIHPTADGPESETKGTTRNVSLGGALINVSGAGDIAFGAAVKLRLPLAPLKADAEIAGTVRWIKDGDIGIQFGSLRAKEVWALNQMFRDAPVA